MALGRKSIRRIAAGLLSGSLLLLATPDVASAAPDALRTYVLPGQNVLPEGVAVRGGTYYVTSTNGGAVYRGDLRQRRAEIFLPPGQHGRTFAAGIKATATRLVIAGGPTGLVSVYDRRNGSRVAQFSNDLPADQTFINDVAIAPNGDAYVTDSVRPVLYRIPAAKLARHRAGVQPLTVFRNFTGTALQYQDGFNANGIVATPDGRFVLVGQSNTGRLYRVRLADGAVSRVDIDGGALTAADGLVLLDFRVLYVVRNSFERVVEVRLGPSYGSGRVVSVTTSPAFQFPTTAAVAGNRLLLVNSQFGGPGEPPFTLTSIPLP